MGELVDLFDGVAMLCAARVTELHRSAEDAGAVAVRTAYSRFDVAGTTLEPSPDTRAISLSAPVNTPRTTVRP